MPPPGDLLLVGGVERLQGLREPMLGGGHPGDQRRIAVGLFELVAAGRLRSQRLRDQVAHDLVLVDLL
ncbi:hypothetical protein [Micromonospora carbonacea]|uniref:hypothetical protein n=1 Tax=Micromonospora carbonacea TaxID=47853 RepID=UPI003720C6AA